MTRRRRTRASVKRETTTQVRRWRCGYSGKWSYESRKDARRMAKVAHPHDTQLTAYRCSYEDHWHIGHVDVYAREQSRRTA